jgi:hypothetical protein
MYYAILPSGGGVSPAQYCDGRDARVVPVGFEYNSGSNERFLTVDELRHLIRTHLPTLSGAAA